MRSYYLQLTLIFYRQPTTTKERKNMKKVLQIGLIFVLAIMLQACGSGGMDRVKLIRALNANDIDTFKAEVTRIRTDPDYSPEDRAERMYFALMFAAEKSTKVTNYVLDQGVSLDYPTGQPTHNRRGMALRSAVEANQPEIVSLLLERGADPNIKLWTPGPDDNILYVSTWNRDLTISRILLEAGANPNLWRNPFYPSLIAFYGRRPDIQRLLEEYGGVKDPTPEQRAGLVKGLSAPKVVVATVQAKQDATDKTVEDRLQTILALKEQGVISEEEYSEARSKILSDL
jgi:Ankyrin repeat